MQNKTLLLEPYQLNAKLRLKNRIIMAPMTRNMADNDYNPTHSMAEYYARRADAGLVITEGTIIRPDGRNITNVPGIFTSAHIEGWKRVTDAVHNQNGHIFLQLWHVGRASHPFFLNGGLPLSPSETVMSQRAYRSENLTYGKSRAATLDEIKGLIESYALAAKNSLQAGFDGIEIHGANGYLVDQFLHYHTNLRTDQYGQLPQNMARFALEIVKACGDVIGYERVGIRLSPGGYLNEVIGDKRDAAVFQYLLEQLNQHPIAYVHTGNFDDKVKFDELANKTMTEFMRPFYKGTLVACGSYDFDEAACEIAANSFDLLAVGRPFIANPNLIALLQQNKEIRQYETSMLQVLY